MVQRSDIQLGMVVRTRDGTQVGRIIDLMNDGLVVEKGAFFIRDYFIPYREVQAVSGEELFLNQTRAHLERMHHQQGTVSTHLGTVASVDATGALSLEPTDLEEARMDSEKFQDPGQYDVRPTGHAAHAHAHEHLGPERRASGPGWDALEEEEKAPRTDGPETPDSKTRY
jgi:hypothetical protein